MNVISIFFWGLVLATLIVTLRWGAMIGLIVFVLALLAGAVAVSRFPTESGASTVHGVSRTPVVEEARGVNVRARILQP